MTAEINPVVGAIGLLTLVEQKLFSPSKISDSNYSTLAMQYEHLPPEFCCLWRSGICSSYELVTFYYSLFSFYSAIDFLNR